MGLLKGFPRNSSKLLHYWMELCHANASSRCRSTDLADGGSVEEGRVSGDGPTLWGIVA